MPENSEGNAAYAGIVSPARPIAAITIHQPEQSTDSITYDDFLFVQRPAKARVLAAMRSGESPESAGDAIGSGPAPFKAVSIQYVGYAGRGQADVSGRGDVIVEFSGLAGRTYVTESSSNLVKWVPVEALRTPLKVCE